jgi:hypothetical protein
VATLARATDDSCFKMSDHGETEEEEYFRLERERHSGYVKRLLANDEKEKWNVFEHEYLCKVQEYQAQIDKQNEWIRAVNEPDPELVAWIAQRPASLQGVEPRKFVIYCVSKIRGRYPPKPYCPPARSIPWSMRETWAGIITWDHRWDKYRTQLSRLREIIENMLMVDEKAVTEKEVQEASKLAQELGYVDTAKILPLLYRQLNEFLANHPRSH